MNFLLAALAFCLFTSVTQRFYLTKALVSEKTAIWILTSATQFSELHAANTQHETE